FGRAVGHFYCLAIFLFFRRTELVSGVWFGSPAKANHLFENARLFVECRLDAPKTTASENRGLRSGWGGTLPIARRRNCHAAKSEKKNSIHTVSFMSLRTRRCSRCFTSKPRKHRS